MDISKQKQAETAARNKAARVAAYGKAVEELTAARQSGASPARITELEERCGVLRLQSESITTRMTQSAVAVQEAGV